MGIGQVLKATLVQVEVKIKTGTESIVIIEILDLCLNPLTKKCTLQ